MKKLICITIFVAMLISFAGCDTTKPVQQPSNQTSVETPSTEEKDYSVTREFTSQAIAKNIVDEKSERVLSIYLPPSYYDSDKKYPVVYFLHGYGETAEIYTSSFASGLNKEFNNGANEFIVVGIDGRNQLGGSFYANSPIFGNWEDYVIDEAIPLIDKEFRTLAAGESRGICGFSMGGYAAYNLAFTHPDVFSSFIAASPGAIADGDIKSAFDSWDPNFKQSYAQAFSPDANNTDTFASIPEFTGTPEDNEIIANWENGYGNLNKKIDDYLALNKPLKAAKITYGENDNYSWIPKGCDFLSESLKTKGVEHTLEKLPMAHRLPPEFAEKHLVPFFNENLVY